MEKSGQKKRKIIEIGIVCLYAILYIVVTVFHEPWFDEAQAWEIAKCGSYKDLLFLIPHGEGHPPLWSLILSIPAKLGVPYEIGLKSVAFAFSVATVYLIVFKSPFSKWVRYSLPFTYFIFYQYGVISRTYCVVMFLLFLLASCFDTKDEHPYRFVTLLAFLCASTAYGIVIAGGICICWCIDIWQDSKNTGSDNIVKNLFRDKRVKALLCLFVIAVLLMLEIMPYGSTTANNATRYEYLGKKIIYMLFAMQGDAFVSSTFPEVWENTGLIDFIPGILATLVSWVYFCIIVPRKRLKYYFVPEFMFASVMTYYGFQHHSGICVLIYIAMLWASYDGDYDQKMMAKIRTRFKENDGKIIAGMLKLIPGIAIAVMLVYSAMSAQKDMLHPYSEGKEIAQFIKEHHMEEALIMAEWYSAYSRNGADEETDEEKNLSIEDFDSNFVATAVPIVSYFDRNIIFNHNDNYNHVGYVTHFTASMEENLNNYSRWAEYGYPEVIIGSPQIEFVYGDKLTFSDYEVVLCAKNCPIWKGSMSDFNTRVYVRKDCLAQYGLD